MSLDTLIANLDHPDEAERMYAAEDLGSANDPAGIAPLCQRLKGEPGRAVKEAIMAALGRLEHPEVLKAAAALLRWDDPYICSQMVELLARRGAAALPHVEPILRDGDDHARKLALDVIGRIQAPGLDELYRRVLRDPNVNMVITAVEYIGANRVNNLKPEMEALFDQAREPMLLTAALETLCVVGDSTSLDRILTRFHDLSIMPEMLRYSIVKAIGGLGGMRHSPRLALLLEGHLESLAQPVVDALMSIRARFPRTPFPQGLRQALLAFLDRDIPEVLRCQIVMLFWHHPLDSETKSRLEMAAQRVTAPDLVQGLRERMEGLCPL